MQEHGNQVQKIILNPLMTREEARHQRDYFLVAEKIVDERRRKKKAEKESFLHKLHLPGLGELAHDTGSDEKSREAIEKRQREREQEQERIQRKLMQEQAKIEAAHEAMTFPAAVILESVPPTLPSTVITEPPGS